MIWLLVRYAPLAPLALFVAGMWAFMEYVA